MAARPEHRVRRQRLVVDAATPELALALQSRLSELNQRALLPAIEAVLAELAPPGRQVRIDRLDVDLGEMTPDALDDELPRRLRAALREALGDALRGGPDDPAPGVAWRREGEARMELLGHWLARGTLPFWAPRAPPSLEALVMEGAAADPAALAATVRRLGRSRASLERLAAQLRDPALAALVRALEPEHAALVLAYVTDLRRVHRRAPLIPVAEPRFRRLLWVLAHAYLVRDPGTEFNRKSFLRSLLRGMARDQGVPYAGLLVTLRAGLSLTRRHRAAGASLPAVLASLLHDLEAGSSPDHHSAADPVGPHDDASTGDGDERGVGGPRSSQATDEDWESAEDADGEGEWDDASSGGEAEWDDGWDEDEALDDAWGGAGAEGGDGWREDESARDAWGADAAERDGWNDDGAERDTWGGDAAGRDGQDENEAARDEWGGDEAERDGAALPERRPPSLFSRRCARSRSAAPRFPRRRCRRARGGAQTGAGRRVQPVRSRQDQHRRRPERDRRGD